MKLYDLSKYKVLQKVLERNVSTLASLRSKSQVKAQVLTGMPHAPGVGDPTGDFVVEIGYLEAEVQRLAQEIHQEKQKTVDFINTVEDGYLRTVFSLRFVHDMSWGAVARTLGGNNTSDSVRMMCCRYLDGLESPPEA